MTLCAVRDGGSVRCAVSGYGSAPLLVPAQALAGGAAVCGELAGEAADSLSGSGAYKRFVLENMVGQALANLGVK